MAAQYVLRVVQTSSLDTWFTNSLHTRPPGGTYTPPPTTATVANPTVYTTTDTPAAQTPPGTIANCGKFYTVQPDDECNTVALRFGITFDQLRAMNPSLDATCSNLFLDEAYCVALVDGTTITATPTSSAPPTATSFVPPPGPTQPGATTECLQWYTTVSRDYCFLVQQQFSITFEQLRTWNPYLDEACSNMWLGYSYCVAGP
jgi:spore germination protein YaaH